jgi:hypothetical protein
MWRCPLCGREFARAKQAHSCQVRAIEEHFRGKDPGLRAIFDVICQALEQSGPLRLDSVESTINLASNYHFGGITVYPAYLRISFLADHEIRDERILHAQRVGPHRVSHNVLVSSLRDVDDQILGWLAEAQKMQARLSS